MFANTISYTAVYSPISMSAVMIASLESVVEEVMLLITAVVGISVNRVNRVTTTNMVPKCNAYSPSVQNTLSNIPTNEKEI